VNEHDWLLATSPFELVQYVRGKASDRKLRLFACACVRHRWELLRYATPRQAAELAERFAEGAASLGDVEPLRQQADISAGNAPEFERLAYRAAAATLAEGASEAAMQVCELIRDQFVFEEANAAMSREDEVRVIFEAQTIAHRALVRLAHEVFGNPFRKVTIEPAWLHAADGAALALARWIDEERRYEELPYLADALTDAGCTEEALLRHLRERGGHVRGCWALDAVLGRE
jgi:hypothetical protein